MSIEPEVPPQEDMKTTLLWAGGAVALVGILIAFAL
jgi:hypothetical protein